MTKEYRMQAAARQLQDQVKTLGGKEFSFNGAGIEPYKQQPDDQQTYYNNCLQAVWNIAEIFRQNNPEDLQGKKDLQQQLDRQYKYLSSRDVKNANKDYVGTLAIDNQNAELGEAFLKFLQLLTDDRMIKAGKRLPGSFSSKPLYTMRDELTRRLEQHRTSPSPLAPNIQSHQSPTPPNSMPRSNSNFAERAELVEEKVVVDEEVTQLHTLVVGLNRLGKDLGSKQIPSLDNLKDFFHYAPDSEDKKRLEMIFIKYDGSLKKPKDLEAFKEKLDRLIAEKLQASAATLLNISTKFHRNIEQILKLENETQTIPEKQKIDAEYILIKETSEAYAGLVTDLMQLKPKCEGVLARFNPEKRKLLEQLKLLEKNQLTLNVKQEVVRYQYESYVKMKKGHEAQNQSYAAMRKTFFGDDSMKEMGLGGKAREYLVERASTYRLGDRLEKLFSCCNRKKDANNNPIPTTAKQRKAYLEELRACSANTPQNLSAKIQQDIGLFQSRNGNKGGFRKFLTDLKSECDKISQPEL